MPGESLFGPAKSAANVVLASQPPRAAAARPLPQFAVRSKSKITRVIQFLPGMGPLWGSLPCRDTYRTHRQSGLTAVGRAAGSRQTRYLAALGALS